MISDMNGVNTKTEFRRNLKESLRVFTDNPSLKTDAESRLHSTLTPFLKSRSGLIGAFHPLKEEPNLSNLYVSSHHQWCFPKMTSVSDMSFVKIESFNRTVWTPDTLGFSYPASGEAVEVEKLDAVLIPGLGFSSHGERLGRGKGFYDKYLFNFKGLKIGVCFDCQWTEDHLPMDDWDIKMNYIITESKCVEIKD